MDEYIQYEVASQKEEQKPNQWRHKKFECPNIKHNVNLSIENSFLFLVSFQNSTPLKRCEDQSEVVRDDGKVWWNYKA